MYLVHIYAYPYKYTYIQVFMAQNSCISQTQPISHGIDSDSDRDIKTVTG